RAGLLEAQRRVYEANSVAAGEVPVQCDAAGDYRARASDLVELEPGARVARDLDVVARLPGGGAFEAHAHLRDRSAREDDDCGDRQMQTHDFPGYRLERPDNFRPIIRMMSSSGFPSPS